MSSEQVEAVQDVVVAAINALGVALIGSGFASITSSPIPDEEIAQILASVSARAEASPETVSPVPASPNPPDARTSVHSPSRGPQPTPGSRQ